MTSTNKGFHTLQGPPISGKTFVVKYLTHQLELQGKKVLLLDTIGATTLPLSPHAYTLHSIFKTPIRGYLITIIELTSTL